MWHLEAWLPWRSPDAEPEFPPPALDPQPEIDRCLNCDKPDYACDFCGRTAVGKMGRKPIYVDLHMLREMMDQNINNHEMCKILGICEGTLVSRKKLVKQMILEGKL